MHAHLTTVHAPIRGASNAKASWSTRVAVQIKLMGPRGIGVGEAAPLPGISPDRLRQCRYALERMPWPSDVESVEDVRDAVERLPEALPAARFGAETALLDYLGRTERRPVWSLLSDEVSSYLPLAYAIWVESDRAMTIALSTARQRRLAAVKLKVGRADRHADELRWIADARERLGPNLQLRLDANRSLPLGEVERRLADYAVHAPAFLEEPVPFEDLMGLESPVPLALDESLAGAKGRRRFERAVEAGKIHAVVLKPSLLGGALACLDLAREAKAAGVVAVVSHLLDGSISRAAASHLALATDGPPPGLGPHPALESLSCGLWTPFIDRIRIHAPQTPGLGLGVGW